MGVTGVKGQTLVTVPDAHVTYLGGSERPEGTEGLKEVPPAAATALLFSGGFSFGAAGMLRTALDAAPNVSLVAFDSPGGRPLVAEQVATLIRARHLNTYVERYCASACTVAFVSGAVRSANRKAKFGFHLAASVALEGLSKIVFVRMERRWFVRSGVSLSFGNRALHAPNLDPYLPPLDELVAAGYLHRVRGVSASVAGKPTADGPLLAEIRAVEPQTAQVMLSGERRRITLGVAPERARAITLNNAGLVVDRWLSRSSDAAIMGMVDATIAALTALAPEPCMRWQVGISNQESGLLAIPVALRAKLEAAQIAVLHDARTHPTPMPPETYEDADTVVRGSIEAQYGKQALSNAATPEHAFDDPAKSCAVSIAYLRGLRERPEGPSVLRWALAAG